MAGSIKGIIVEIGGDTSGLQKALSKVNSATSSLSRELRGVNSLLKLDPKNTELLKQKQDILNESISNTQNKLKQLQELKEKADDKMANGTKINSENYRALQREIINTENKLKKLQVESSKLTQIGRKFEEIGTKIQNVGNKIDSLGNKLTTRITAPLVALGVIGVKSAAEQEASMQQVELIYGEASDTIKDFAENTAITFNMSTKEAYKYSQVYGNLIQSITDDEEENALYTQQLLESSAIIASATGRTMEDVMDRIRSGLLGNTEAIEDLGVNVNVALLESTDAFKKFAGDKSWKQLDFQTQQQIRLFGILEQTTKKYGTEVNKNTASSIQKLTARLNNLVSRLNKKLIPIAEDLMDIADDFIEKLEDLTDEEMDNIIKIGLMVAAAGPLIKILGTVTKTVGTASKGIGIFSQAVAVAKNGTTSSITSVNNLAKAFSALTSPVGLATLGITAGITALVVAFQKATEETRNYAKETEESLQSVLKEKEAIDELKASIDTESQAKLYEVERSRDLWEELKKITDENGKIKKGYENRAKVITNELSEALGTEISITNNVVKKYKELQKEIDNLILKKKAEIILNANEEKYAEAIKNRTQKAQELLDKQDELNKAKEEENKLYEEYEKTVKDVWKASPFQNLVAEQNWKNQKEAVSNLKNEVSTLSKIVDGYTQDMQDYNYNFELYSEGTKESLTELSNTVQQTYQKNGETVKTSYAEQIKEQQIYLSKAKTLNEQAIKENNEAEIKKTQNTIEESDKRLTKIIEELIAQPDIVTENSPDVVNAWKQLATSSYDKYSSELKKMPKEMRKKIEDITGVVSNDETVAKEMEELAKESVKAFEENANTFDTGKFFVMGLKDGLNDTKTRDLLFGSVVSLGKKMISSLNKSLDEHSPSKETKTSGINFIQGLINGINSKQREALSLVSKFGTNMTSNLNNNLLNGNMEFSNSKLSSQVIDSTKTVFTTPQIVFNVQELDEARLNQCFNYVNRKFGSQY